MAGCGRSCVNQALAASLAVNSTLTHLDLAGNKIGDDGAQAEISGSCKFLYSWYDYIEWCLIL